MGESPRPWALVTWPNHFAIREGGKTVGSGVITEVVE
jgi:translation elongation factor EF-Tu-like GTPase